MRTLDRIAQLREALRPDAMPEQATTWWDLYDGLESNLLVFDDRTTKHERSVLDQLKSGLSQATRDRCSLR